MIKLAILLSCGILHYLGGRAKEQFWNGNKKIFRHIYIAILSIYVAIACKTWWLFFAQNITQGTIGLGYGAISPDDPKPSFLAKLLNDKQGWLTRGMWGLINAFILSIWLLCFGYINLWQFMGYLALNFVIGAVFCALKACDFIIEPAVGIGLGSIVFLV